MTDLIVRKGCLKNIYCSTCKKWMIEFNVSRHISSKLHMTRRSEKEKRLQKETLTSRPKRLTSCSSGDFKSKTPEKQQEYEQFQLQGDTLKKCSHTHQNIFMKSCNDLLSSQSPPKDTSDKVKKQLFNEDEAVNTTFEELPQNQLGVLGIEDCWDFDVALLGDESDINANGENVNMLQPISIEMVQNVPNASAEFPIEVLSEGFSEARCSGFHNNQIAYYRCHVCNSAASSGDYVSW